MDEDLDYLRQYLVDSDTPNSTSAIPTAENVGNYEDLDYIRQYLGDK